MTRPTAVLSIAILLLALATACTSASTAPPSEVGPPASSASPQAQPPFSSASPAEGSAVTLESISLEDLPLGDEVFDAGAILIRLDPGLTPIVAPPGATEASTAIVTVHGLGSEGYEWVYPLHQYLDAGIATYFYRWDWSQCPGPASQQLAAVLPRLLDERPQLDRLIVVGHSYGGVVVANLATSWDATVPLEAHVVAAPLAIDVSGSCGSWAAFIPAPSTSLTQWRTRWELDDAFSGLSVDPQLVDIPGSEVVLLPETYEGDRLGHNRSLSWVADQIVTSD